MITYSNFRSVFLFVMLFGFFSATAQTGVTLKFKKDKPVQINTYERLYDPNALGTSKKQTRKQNNFTEAEVEEIFERLAKNELLPKGLTNSNSSKLAQYVAFEVGKFTFFGYSFSLVWIPYEDNAQLSADMQPPTKDGSIYYTYTKHLLFNPKRDNNTTAQTHINVSTADMNAFLGGGNNGRKSPTNSSFNKADAALVDQAIREYNKMDERLRTLDKLYSVEYEKIKKQIEKDAQTKVRANLFMNKERANANAYLAESRKLLKDYLVKYDAAIGADFKATLEGWLNDLPYYIPI